MQNITQKSNDRATRTPLKSEHDHGFLRKDNQFLLMFHLWHPSCYSCYKSGDKSWM